MPPKYPSSDVLSQNTDVGGSNLLHCRNPKVFWSDDGEAEAGTTEIMRTPGNSSFRSFTGSTEIFFESLRRRKTILMIRKSLMRMKRTLLKGSPNKF